MWSGVREETLRSLSEILSSSKFLHSIYAPAFAPAILLRLPQTTRDQPPKTDIMKISVLDRIRLWMLIYSRNSINRHPRPGVGGGEGKFKIPKDPTYPFGSGTNSTKLNRVVWDKEIALFFPVFPISNVLVINFGNSKEGTKIFGAVAYFNQKKKRWSTLRFRDRARSSIRPIQVRPGFD